MAARIVQNSFAGGELSPAIYGRFDIAAYFKGAASIENFIVKKTGGLQKRGGLRPGHAWTTAADEDLAGIDTTVVPYRYNRTDGGLLILTEESDGGTGKQIRATYLPKGTSFGQGTGLATGVLPAYIYPPSARWRQVGDTLLISGLEEPEAAGSPPVPATVASILVDHEANTLTIGEYAVNQKPVAPYYSLISYTTNMQTSGDYARTFYYAGYTVIGGVISDPLTASVSNMDSRWPAGGRITVRFRVKKDTTTNDWPEEIVIGKRSGALYGELARLQASDFNSEGSTSGVPYREYIFYDENHIPGTLIYKQTALFEDGTSVAAMSVNLFQQRLCFSGLPSEPFSILFSMIADLHCYHADRPVAADDPFRVTMATDSPAVIRHSVTFRDAILLFTDTGVWTVSGSSTEGFYGGTCRIFQMNDIGCAPDISPIKTTDGVVYVGADKRTVYELRYDLTQDTIMPIERSILSDHLTEGRTIRSIAHQRYPDSIVWVILDNGTILSFTYQPEHELYAWAHHAIPSASGIGTPIQIVATDTVTGANSDVLVICSSPGESANGYRVYRIDPENPVDDETDVSAYVTTLRPESPDRSVQGIKKNIMDCLVRVRNTRTISVKPNDPGVAAVSKSVVEEDDPFTGDWKIMPRGLIGEDGQMTILSESGPCEIQCVIFNLEF